MLDPRLSPLTDQLSAKAGIARVLMARVYRLPFARVRVRVALQQPRRFNILEEFVLRAAATLNPPPAPGELPSLLGLDAPFVENTLQTLEQGGALTRSKTALTLTTAGRDYYQKGYFPQAPEYKALSLLYLPATDEMRVWEDRALTPETATGDPVFPGLPYNREEVSKRALAGATPDNVIDALDFARLNWHAPKENRLLTGADQAALEETGFYAAGIVVLQKADDALALRAVRWPAMQTDSALEEVLNQWLAAGRLTLEQLLPDAVSDGSAAVDDLYRPLAEQAGSGVELLPPQHAETRLGQFAHEAQHTLLALAPALTPESLPEALYALEPAARHVITLLGWGAAETREAEIRPPTPAVVEDWQRRVTPDGLPAGVVWWIGELVGRDLIADHTTLLSSLPDTVRHGKKTYQLGQRTYRVTHSDLVQETLENVEPALARAARQSWQAHMRYAAAGRLDLERCCLTWVSIRRPSEALTSILKLAATGPAAAVMWELFTVTGLALARLPEADLNDMGAFEALARAIPDLLARDPATDDTASDYVGRLKQLLAYYAEGAPSELALFLGEMRDLWRQLALTPPGQTVAGFFEPLVAEPPKDKKKPTSRAKPKTGSLSHPDPLPDPAE